MLLIKQYIMNHWQVPIHKGTCKDCEYNTSPYAKDNPEGYFCEIHNLITKNFKHDSGTFGCTMYEQSKN